MRILLCTLALLICGATPLAAEEAGFSPLFNGKDLDGWMGATGGYSVADGVLQCRKQGGGSIYTKQEYGNFVLKFEFKLTKNANNGLGIRAPGKGDAAYVGMELQILDNTGDKYQKLKDYQYHGSIYGVVPAKRGHLKPVGEWNKQTVIADGGKIKVILNGEVIVDADLEKIIADGKTVDGKGVAGHPGLKREKGHIGFLGHGADVYFRNLRIKQLP